LVLVGLVLPLLLMLALLLVLLLASTTLAVAARVVEANRGFRLAKLTSTVTVR
jgi:hypothetical protein